MQKSPLAVQSYNSLQDEHLVEYFSSPHRRRHLRRMGLITKDGRLVDELTFQRKALQRECSKKYRDMMANTTVTTVTDTQRQRRAELKKKLETLAKYETVRRIKKEKLHPPGIQRYRPRNMHAAPGPDSARLGQTSPTSECFPHSRLSRILETHKDRVIFSPEELREFKELVENITGARMISPTPCRIVPRPPSTPKPRNPAAVKVESGHIVRRRPHTAPTKTHRYTGSREARPSGQNESVVKVTLRFLGTSTTLNCRQAVGRRRKQKIQVKKGAASKSELNLALTGVVVQQQARGYTPVTVYKGQIRPGDSFSFQSIRCTGMPYALVLYTGGMSDCRVSVCCEYRHRAGTLLGGKSAHFRVVAVEGGTPCYQCRAGIEERCRSKLKKTNQMQLDEDLQHHPSNEQLSTLLGSTTQLEGSVRHSSAGEEREREEGGKSPSPVSSLHSASFHSESPQLSSDEDEGEGPSQRGGSVQNLHSLSERMATVTMIQSEEPERSSETKSTDDLQMVLVRQNAVEEEKDPESHSDCHPPLVTKGGVTIVYELGPISTSESATQTDEQLTTSKPLPETVTQDINNATAPEHVPIPSDTDISKDDESKKEDNCEEGKEEAAETGNAGRVESDEKEGAEDGEVQPQPLTHTSNITALLQSDDLSSGQEEVTSSAVPQWPKTDDESPVSQSSLPEVVTPAITDTNVPTSTATEQKDSKLDDTSQTKDEEAELTQSSHTAAEIPPSSSHPDHQPPHDIVNESITPSDESEWTSKSTLTQVSDRKTSTASSTASTLDSLSEPGNELQTRTTQTAKPQKADTRETEDPGNRRDPQTTPWESWDTIAGAGAEEDDKTGEEYSTAICEEEFTKAWT